MMRSLLQPPLHDEILTAAFPCSENLSIHHMQMQMKFQAYIEWKMAII